METKVTEISIVPFKPKNGFIALASCVVDGKFYFGGIGIYTRLDGSGYRLTFPTKKVGNGSINLVHPINKETGDSMNKAIVDEYLRVTKESDKKYVNEDKETIVEVEE